MPRFQVYQDSDGTVRRILKDGLPYEQNLKLEAPFTIVQTYFLAAKRNLDIMTSGADQDSLRYHGLQAFLMSLVGLEAFLNVFFHLKSLETGDEAVKDHATSDESVESKLAGLPKRAYGKPLSGQKFLNRKIRELYDLRSRSFTPNGYQHLLYPPLVSHSTA